MADIKKDETIIELDLQRYTFYDMTDLISLCQAGYELEIVIGYPKSTWFVAGAKKEDIGTYYDIEGLTSALSKVSLPIDAIAMFSTCKSFALVGLESLRGISLKQSVVSLDDNGKISKREIDYIDTENKKFLLTEGTESVLLNKDGSWNYSNVTDSCEHTVGQNNSGGVSITSAVIDGDFTKIPSQADIYDAASKKVAAIKVKQSSVFN